MFRLPSRIVGIDLLPGICSSEHVRANRLQNALRTLSVAIAEAQQALDEVKAEPDPLAVHIFVSRRDYRKHAGHQEWQTARGFSAIELA